MRTSPLTLARRAARSPIIRFLLAALALTIVTVVVLAFAGALEPVAVYLESRPAAGRGAFFAVVALMLGAAAAAVTVLAVRPLAAVVD